MKRLLIWGLFLFLLSCNTVTPRPDWVENLPKYKGEGGNLLVLGVMNQDGETSQKDLQRMAETRAKETMTRFLKETLKVFLQNYRIQVGDLQDSEALFPLFENRDFQEKLISEASDLIGLRKSFFDQEKKKFYCLVGLEKDSLIFKFRDKMVEQLHNSQALSPISKETAKKRLDLLLKREKEHLTEKLETWRTRKNG